MDEKLINLFLTLTVGVIMVGALLAPVAFSNELKQKTDHVNVGTEYYDDVRNATISVALGDNFAVTINGESFTVDNYEPIVITNAFMVIRDVGNGVSFSAPNDNKIIVGDTTGDTFTLTLSNGAYSAVLGENTVTGSYTKALVKSDETGDYLRQSTGTINKGAEGLIFVGTPVWTEKQGVVAVPDLQTGSVDYSLKTYTDYQVTGSSDETITWEVHDNGNSSYDISEFEDSGGVTIDGAIFIPKEYYTYDTTANSALITVIPLVCIVALLGMVAFVISRKNDE